MLVAVSASDQILGLLCALSAPDESSAAFGDDLDIRDSRPWRSGDGLSEDAAGVYPVSEFGGARDMMPLRIGDRDVPPRAYGFAEWP